MVSRSIRTLCRVPSYDLPGLPSPTRSQGFGRAPSWSTTEPAEEEEEETQTERDDLASGTKARGEKARPIIFRAGALRRRAPAAQETYEDEDEGESAAAAAYMATGPPLLSELTHVISFPYGHRRGETRMDQPGPTEPVQYNRPAQEVTPILWPAIARWPRFYLFFINKNCFTLNKPISTCAVKKDKQ